MNAAEIEALHALYVENRQEFYTYALSITGNREAAEDAIHGVFERLLRRRGLPPNLRAYVFRSVRNAGYDAWRRTKIRADSIFDESSVVDAAETGSLDAGGADDLGPLLQRLSADEREAIVLKIHGGLTFQQIAELRRTPLPTVASWYRRGLERLKTMLTQER